MNNLNLLSEEVIDVECTGVGKTRESAYENAFVDMRKKIQKRSNTLIITLKAEEVYLKNEKVDSKNEAFMFVFSRRISNMYQVNLLVKVKISYINLERK